MSYYYTNEAVAEIGIETSPGTGVTPTIPIQWLRSATITPNENVTRIYNVGGGRYRKPDTVYKGKNVITGTMTFWLSDDLNATTTEAWILKLALDKFNVAHDGTEWVIPNTGTSAYGSNDLFTFTLEIGHNKTGSIRKHILVGCMVERLSINLREGEPIEFVMDFVAMDGDFSKDEAFTGVTKSTAQPLQWNNSAMYYADDGTQTTRTDFTEFSVTIENNIRAIYDLSQTTPTRVVTTLSPGRQLISGTFNRFMTTGAGLAMYDALLNDASAPYAPTEDVDLKEFEFRLTNTTNPSTEAIHLRIREASIDRLNEEFRDEHHSMISGDFTAGYYRCALVTSDSAGPTSWDDQS